MDKINELFERLELDWDTNNCVIEKYKIAQSEKKQDIYFKDNNDNLAQEILDVLKPLKLKEGTIEPFKGVLVGGVDIKDSDNSIVYVCTYNTNDSYYKKYLYLIKKDRMKINLEDIFKEFSNNRIDNNDAIVYKFNKEEE